MWEASNTCEKPQRHLRSPTHMWQSQKHMWEAPNTIKHEWLTCWWCCNNHDNVLGACKSHTDHMCVPIQYKTQCYVSVVIMSLSNLIWGWTKSNVMLSQHVNDIIANWCNWWFHDVSHCIMLCNNTSHNTHTCAPTQYASHLNISVFEWSQSHTYVLTRA